ncbi:murein DD-endopeptidase MepM/ murein hydrolase activator NlpD [Pelomonas saccharophila]|uniref:Murein DD-endopeptidase MepM/ murein hydrolase activator NlpD n=1 Tax=Roseateles saccharophilus TaxID=304 RepID=A0ABU1YJP0_ROSSA|nr:peptidoglycan DD-metalloendopeptidase family protein [Roseateles saccharophilus]MDR7269073.1 murein DD-endopeptidase MepM/ murein hydrolase activator NlpD [Roseateles saccharophilus]
MTVQNRLQQLQASLQRAEAFAAKHPRALTASVVGALSCFAVTAFGIAPLAPDAAQLPKRTLVEAIATPDIESQLDELAAHAVGLTRAEATRSSDTPDSLLKRAGAFDPAAAAFLRNDPLGRRVLQGRAGKMVHLTADASGQVQQIVVRSPAEKVEQQGSHFTRLTIERVGGRFVARTETAPLQAQVALGSGTIRTSLFAATDDANIPDAIASQMADMFSGDIDFHRELRKGDRFSIVYETLTADGEPVPWDGGVGRLLAGEFTNNGRTYSAVYFKDGVTGKSSFFGFDGTSKRRAFLASPMEFSRITSGFAMRLHPIMNTWRQHNGVDYGAPTGTAVRSVGDGTVEMAGWQNGFGNVVQVRHSGDRSTVYAHLSRIDVKKGQRIEQGMKLGAVGMTGWATGPHLHFEFRVGGRHMDPRTIAKASEAVTLPGYAKSQFLQTVASVKTQLAVAETMDGVSAAD